MRFTNFIKLSILALGICVLGCKPKVKINPKLKLSLSSLTVNNIYDKHLVSGAVFYANTLKTDSLTKKSNALFAKGDDLYKNKKMPDSAIVLLKQSLVALPQPNTYFEIGQVLMDMQSSAKSDTKKSELNEALQAYDMATFLHYQPLAVIYYNMACADNLLASYDSAIDGNKMSFHLSQAIFNLTNAFEHGFNDTATLQKDGRLTSLINTDSYRQIITQLNAKTDFDKYKVLFPVLTQPYANSVDSLDMKGAEISTDFASFIPGMVTTHFDRGVNQDYYAIGKIAETQAYTALIYSTSLFDGMEDPEYWQGPNMVSTFLLTYSPTGTVIDSLLISCRCTEESAKTVKIANNIITTQDYTLTWKYSDSVMNNFQSRIFELQQKQEEYTENITNTNATDTTQQKNLQNELTDVTTQVDSLNTINNAVVKKQLGDKKSYRLKDDGKIEEIHESAKTAMK